MLTVKLRYQEPCRARGQPAAPTQPLAGAAAPDRPGFGRPAQFAAGSGWVAGCCCARALAAARPPTASAARLAPSRPVGWPRGYRAELVRLARLAEGMALGRPGRGSSARRLVAYARRSCGV
ncbi:MAG: hypothetical protein WKG07_09305 [Hymenobacter sp.]